MSRRRKKRKDPMGWIIMLLFVLLIAYVLYRYEFVFRDVSLTGTSSVKEEDILRAANLSYGCSIFRCDEKKIQKSINALGEIEAVSVTKVLPSTIAITVRQRTPSMMAVHLNKYVTMDEKGYVIRIGDDITSGTLVFTGLHIMFCEQGMQISADNGQVDAMCAIASAIRNADGVRCVKEIDIEDLSNIKITAVNNTIVEVGTTESVETKMAWMTAAINDLVSRGQTGGTLDVTSGTKADYELPPVVEEVII